MSKGIFCVVVLALLGVADAALAATAEFQGFCTNSSSGGTLQTHCKFTVLRHPFGTPATNCGALGIASTSWNFGDGTTGSSPGTIEHDYTGAVSTMVSVTVNCVDGSSASASHCFDNNIGFGGCIIPGAGWTPQ